MTDFTLKRFVAYGPGFYGDYNTEEEARTIVQANGTGAVYQLLPGPDHCEHGVPDFEYCEPCNREYKRARHEAGDDAD